MLKYLKINIMAFLLYSCTEKIVSDQNTSPQIGFVKISADKVIQFKDSLSITIHYKDGDGDLGDIHPDSLSLFVRDMRLNNSDRYHLKPLSPNNAKINVEGEMVVKLKNIFLLSPSPSESTSFEIKLKDRSNHWSNIVYTPKIEIIR